MITKTGNLINKRVFIGTRSEQDAYVLDMGDEEFILRQKNGAPFDKSIGEDLIGKKITIKGAPDARYFFVFSWEESIEKS